MMLSDLLRKDRLTPPLREQLADLIDPRASTARKLQFCFRRKGKRPEWAVQCQLSLAFKEARAKGSSYEEAISLIAEKFDLDDSTVKKTLRRFRRADAGEVNR